MGRPLRIEFPGAWYHVMNRGGGRRSIFHSDGSRHLFLQLLGEISKLYFVEIHAYSLMNNHYHLLIHTPRAGLSEAMRYLNGVYTQTTNRKHKTDGPLFRGRYKSVLVDSDEYLLELVRYIHMNPVEAGICQHPRDHPWTSHRAYLSKGVCPSWFYTDEVLSRFGKNRTEALRGMRKFIGEPVPESIQKTLLEERVIIGGEGFKEWIYNNWKTKGKQEGVPLRDQQVQKRADIKTILEIVGHAFDLSVKDLRTGGRFRGNVGRKMAIYFMRQLAGLPQNKIATCMKAKNGATIAKVLERYQKELASDRQLQKLNRSLAKQIMSYVKP